MNTLARAAIVVLMVISFALRTAQGQSSPSQTVDDLRLQLAQCDLDRSTLDRKLKILQKQIDLAKDTTALLKRVETAEAQANAARKEEQKQRARADALEREKADLLGQLKEGRTTTELATPTAEPSPSLPLPADNSGWRVAEETTIDGTVQWIKLESIFKTATGNLYQVTAPVLDLVLELNPKVTVLTDGTQYKLIINGVKEALICKLLGGTVGPTAAVIESKIDADFDGFSPDRVYKLRNGQIWQQTSSKYSYRYKFAPSVTIWKDGSVYKMHVDGLDDTITVKPLR